MDSFSGLEKFFMACAVFGGTLLVIRLVIQFMTGFGDADADAGEVDGDSSGVIHDGDVHADSGGHAMADLSFKLLTLQGLMAFFLMFGLVGFALLRQTHVHEIWSVAGALAAGMGAVWIMDKMFRLMGRLQSAGNIDYSSAIGQVGEVYLTIRPGSTGKVQLVVGGRYRVMEAVSNLRREFSTGERVIVKSIVNSNVLVVEPSE